MTPPATNTSAGIDRRSFSACCSTSTCANEATTRSVARARAELRLAYADIRAVEQAVARDGYPRRADSRLAAHGIACLESFMTTGGDGGASGPVPGQVLVRDGDGGRGLSGGGCHPLDRPGADVSGGEDHGLAGSSGIGARDRHQCGAAVVRSRSVPVRTNPRSLRATVPASQAARGSAPMSTNTAPRRAATPDLLPSSHRETGTGARSRMSARIRAANSPADSLGRKVPSVGVKKHTRSRGRRGNRAISTVPVTAAQTR
jgi:hypothetical protein